MAVKRAYYGNNSDRDYFERVFQSANINFLIGSGASLPAIKVLGSIETDLQQLINDEQEEEYFRMTTDFLSAVWLPHECMLERGNGAPFAPPVITNVECTRANYDTFMSSLEKILTLRRTGLLPRRINVFTTNYDLFIEEAATRNNNILFNDGFNKRANIWGVEEFDAGSFNYSVSATGNLYNYKVELPTVNLIKLHGSLSWEHYKGKIIYNIGDGKPLSFATLAEMKKWVLAHALILPRKEKFKETLLQNVYYDLLRTYSNELDKEATLLVIFGFSFADEHLETITKKALRNATLKLLIFAFNEASVDGFMEKFRDYSNVEIIYRPGGNVDFPVMNNIITCYLGGSR
ncbi:SIR2 family protein [Serratia sp. JSRIV006]|uniref:SIR2 family protein n=1 Tax=Serratia sp. JSRIV006 TaxID=2831896 RepID=UPI001CC10572|nr:SIR2 family protein [Serratia sp. JSRIV006]UAN63125.1 SIR2 family protein [Serratia sp. JSRIV006]